MTKWDVDSRRSRLRLVWCGLLATICVLMALMTLGNLWGWERDVHLSLMIARFVAFHWALGHCEFQKESPLAFSHVENYTRALSTDFVSLNSHAISKDVSSHLCEITWDLNFLLYSSRHFFELRNETNETISTDGRVFLFRFSLLSVWKLTTILFRIFK